MPPAKRVFPGNAVRGTAADGSEISRNAGAESLPAELAASRAVQTLFAAEAAGKLPHALLLSGESLQNLERVMFALAGTILGGNAAAHPDFHRIRPENKMRRIGLAGTLELVREIRQTPLVGERKVACIYEPERMGREAANAFLKVLEEPPAGTVIFLLSGAVNQILPTIRSRCLNFRIVGSERFDDARWDGWLGDFREWILGLREGRTVRDVGGGIFSVYGLAARFESLLAEFSEEAWEKTEIPENATAEQRDALHEGCSRGVRRKLLAGIENALLGFARDAAAEGKNYVAETAKSCELLEHLTGLLELNAQISVVVEAFLLNCLRFWAHRR